MGTPKQVKGGVLLEVRVKPNSNLTMLYKKDDNLLLELQSPPEDNKANIEALKYLKRLFGCEVALVHGQKSKIKNFLLKTEVKKIEQTIMAL